jgi:hypothetical protein
MLVEYGEIFHCIDFLLAINCFVQQFKLMTHLVQSFSIGEVFDNISKNTLFEIVRIDRWLQMILLAFVPLYYIAFKH